MDTNIEERGATYSLRSYHFTQHVKSIILTGSSVIHKREYDDGGSIGVPAGDRGGG